MKKTLSALAIAAALSVGMTGVSAGPVILGGDDLADHGSRSTAGVNLEGWLYIEMAISNLLSSETRSGTHTVHVAALGSEQTTGFPERNAGGAIGSVGNVLGLTVGFFNGAAAINQFFVDLLSGAVNPAVIWLAGTGANNDLDDSEGAALTANASAINDFVTSGGGLMAHGSGVRAYGWLSTLLPGLLEVDGCEARGASLTAAGRAAFPGLTNAHIDSNAGPCHSHFEGNFGGLTTLAFDGDNPAQSYIIGGGAATVIVCGVPGAPPCPTLPEPGTVPLLALSAIGFALLWRRRRG